MYCHYCEILLMHLWQINGGGGEEYFEKMIVKK